MDALSISSISPLLHPSIICRPFLSFHASVSPAIPCRRAVVNPSASLRFHHLRLSSSASSLRCSAASNTYRFAEEDEASMFAEAAKKGNLVPLYRCIFSDHLTPILAYRCLVKDDDREAASFLFVSVEQGSRGRYSVVGARPVMEIVAKENLVSIMDHQEGQKTEEIVDDPMTIPQQIMATWSPQLIDELPDAF